MLPPNYYGPGSVWDDMRKKQAAATAAAWKQYQEARDRHLAWERGQSAKFLQKQEDERKRLGKAAAEMPPKGPPPAWLVKLGRGTGEVLYWIFFVAMVFEAVSRFFRFLGHLVGLT